MKTKYILVGGYPHKATDGGTAFFEEMVGGIKQPISILDCLFARPVGTWEGVYAQDKKDIAQHLKNVELNFQLADPDNFTQQVKLCIIALIIILQTLIGMWHTKF